jgi:hypothetical protein
MKVAMMQPTFLPWQGFFELIRRADAFVFLDDFQYCHRSYHQRNRLFLSTGRPDWVTVPVRRVHGARMALNAVQIDDAAPWRGKLLKQLQANYGRSPHFAAVYPPVADWLARPAASLADQNIGFILLVLELLGWQRPLHRSSAYRCDGVRSDRLLALLRQLGASEYLSARGSFDYMREDAVFPVPDIEVKFQNFVPPPYPQVGATGSFVPALSVLDALFNVGAEGTARLISAGTSHWLDWRALGAAQQTANTSGEWHGII